MTHWAHVLAAQTGYSWDVFLDILYVPNGQVIHVLFNLIDRATALKHFPQQEMLSWPPGVATHRFLCMCGRTVPTESGVSNVKDLEELTGHPCQHCLDRLPGHMTDKAIIELVGGDEVDWMHADLLRIGNLKWRS